MRARQESLLLVGSPMLSKWENHSVSSLEMLFSSVSCGRATSRAERKIRGLARISRAMTLKLAVSTKPWIEEATRLGPVVWCAE